MKSPPKPATKEEVRARYHGLDDHVRSTGVEAAWLGLQGVALGVVGALSESGMGTRAAAFAGAAILIAAAIGIARAAEWARWTGGIASLILGVVSLALPFLTRAAGEEAESPKYLFIVIALVTGAYLLSPSARGSFRDAREMRDRLRAAKALA